MTVNDVITPILVGTTIIMLAAIFYGFIAFVFQVAWNFVIPYLFGLPVIGFWHSVVLVFIISMIGALLKGNTKR